MPALRFGPPDRQLFGFHHAPAGVTPRLTSVLLCNPFGQEALRCQRMFRMLGERLARAGFHVLRFDYFATGDSDGDCEEADLGVWKDNIVRSSHELRERAHTSRAAWVGLGLGGSLAARASLQLHTSLAALILWEPVFDGKGYLEELGTTHDRHFKREIEGSVTSRARIGSEPITIVDQLLGFPISAKLQEDFEHLSDTPEAPPKADRVILMPPNDDTKLAASATQWLGMSRKPDIKPVPRWGTTDFDDIIASAVVYNDVIQRVSETLGGLP